MTERVLLIDADVLAYEAASSCEKATEWEPGYWTWHCDFDEVVAKFDSLVEDIVKALKGTAVFCLTDSDGNFRKSILPTYKGSRSKVKKPLVLKPFKQFLIDERKAYFRPGLEGDDCMGILATRSNPKGEERIIVSVDKDMKSVPGLVCRWPIETKPVLISETQADYWHLFQTLTGDVTDGYSGCPGVGPVTAEKLLTDEGGLPPEHINGWRWERVIEAFQKAKLGETEALVQARVARILRASDYDFQKKGTEALDTMKHPIIGLYSSAAQSGKSTVAGILCAEFGYQTVKFAGPLKDMARGLLRAMNIPKTAVERMVEGDLKEAVIPGFETVTPRHIMQTLGTDWGREAVDRDLWLKVAASKITSLRWRGFPVVVDDVRFPNEMAMLRGIGGIVVKVHRPGVQKVGESRYEGLLEDDGFDGIINNDRTLDDLRRHVLTLM